MDLVFNALKGQFNTLNFLLLLILTGIVLLKSKRRKTGKLVLLFSVIFFMLTSTGYLPGYLIQKMESGYPPFEIFDHGFTDDTIYVQALGGGYTLDERLEANSQLSWSSLGRVTEAIRIARLFDKSILVFSGNVASGNQSLASVGKRTAILLGFDSTRITTLDTPATTQQEAQAFKNRFGKKVKLILVTDAIHMARAIRFFKAQGIEAIPAPTNYLIKKDDNPISMAWMPSAENFLLMDRMYREWLGSIKGYFLK